MMKTVALVSIFITSLSFAAKPINTKKTTTKSNKATSSLATTLIEKSEAHIRGKSFRGKMTMKVENNGQTRTLVLRNWSIGNTKSFVKILTPKKDRDTGNLRIDMNLWQYLPNVERVIKIPPSLMLQSWMGSDFTNDDLVKTSSLSRDYTHKILANEKYGTYKAVKIECIPKPNAPIVWGKVIAWVREGDGVPLKQEFYSENGELLKVMEGSEVKTFGKRTIPTVLVMKNLKRENSKTTLTYDEVHFDENIPNNIFTQENLRSPVKD
ncbi:MAG: outer membrane lipoprotein-sorting protein [Oligoflexia bacterium]|nr:outer membrane lipoprotein-sorting protein [Oligoflexia bacterium]